MISFFEKKIQTNPKIFNYLFIIALIFFFEPQIFKEENFEILKNIDMVYKVIKLGLSAIICLIYICNYKISKLSIVMMIFQIVAFISTVINAGSIVRFLGPAVTTVTMIMIAEMLIKNKQLYEVSKKIVIYLRLCFIINIFFIVLVDVFSIWNDNIYFLGIDNRWIFSYLPWMLFEFIVALNENKYKNVVIAFILMEISLIYKWSLAAATISLLWALPLIIKNKMQISKIIIPVFLTTLIANILVIFVKIQNMFSLLLNELKKDVTLSGRTMLWDNVIKKIREKPVLGTGMQSTENDKNFFASSANNKLSFLRVTHAHNSYMTVLYRYGILGLIIYLITFVLPIVKLRLNYMNKYSNVLFIGIVVSLVLSIFDTFDCSCTYFILGCAYSIEYINEENLKSER